MKMFKILKQINGFSLIEAIIATAIVGMIVAPISMVFIGSLNHAIDAREKLKTTQLAQQCIENIKGKSEVDFMDFFATDPIITDGLEVRTIETHEGIPSGFPNIPEKYRVNISYSKDNPDLANEDYKNNSVIFDQYDAILSFHGDPDNNRSFMANNGILEEEFRPSIGTSRIIYITYTEDNLFIQDGSSSTIMNFNTLDGTPIGFDNTYHAIRIECKDTTIPTAANPAYNTKIYVQNETATDIELFIYQAPENTVNLFINDNEGSHLGVTKTYYNMQDAISANRKIYSIKVQIIKKTPQEDDIEEVLTEVVSTKIDD
ncbi:MAG: hypothetical protein CVU84_00180 [Firmicutes bacterium HGW-Firmicutes-1]|jgi:type II secretory pathway pseudopilin PulG|nr:MAG: hypothetical protein CVU84_00180 [Firmicutes bacterium HGW-Firmicutes-1]